MPKEKIPSPFSGKRKTVASTIAIRCAWPWPKTASVQDEVIATWRQVAMQILHKNNASFRLIAIVPFALSRENGEIWDSNKTLAALAGGCSERTITRDVETYVSLGIVIVEEGWRESLGKMVRTRKLKLAMPLAMPGYVKIT